MKRLLALLFLLPSLAVAQESQNRIVTDAITHQAAAYASGDVIGDVVDLSSACNFRTNKGEILGVKVFDKAAQSVDLWLVLFKTTPAGTFTDNSAFDPTDAGLLDITAVIPITSHAAFSDNGMSYASNILVPVACDSTGKLFGYLVSRGAPTYGSTTDLTVQIELAPNM